jgi:hypothetical protein
MRSRKSNADLSLATLCETIELAHGMAEDLPASASPSYLELIEALTCARISALRIAAELMRARKRLQR